jgi:hypothetical protein
LGFLYVLYSTLLHLPPPRFHCVDGCWDRTQDCCKNCNASPSLYSVTIRLDLIRISLFKLMNLFIPAAMETLVSVIPPPPPHEAVLNTVQRKREKIPPKNIKRKKNIS